VNLCFGFCGGFAAIEFDLGGLGVFGGRAGMVVIIEK